MLVDKSATLKREITAMRDDLKKFLNAIGIKRDFKDQKIATESIRTENQIYYLKLNDLKENHER